MKHLFFTAKFLLLFFLSSGNSIFLDLKSDEYMITQTDLKNGNVKCKLINCIKKEFIFNENSQLIKPLILFKIFGVKIENPSVSLKIKSASLGFDLYLKQTVLPMLLADMQLGVSNIGQNKSVQSINVFDTIILFSSGNYEIYKGVICAEFFNLIDFEQYHILQSNQTILNTKAKIIKVEQWLKDSLPIGENNNYEVESSKIFLLKKDNDHYVFYKYSLKDEDSPLSFYREYVYKKDYGIIAFKSKFLFRIKDEYRSDIIASDEYYYFR